VKPHNFSLAGISFSKFAMIFAAQFNAIKKMQCPFLTRLSTNYVRNYGASLLKNYANQCPVASRVISNIANAQTATEGMQLTNLMCRGN
jgi:5-aminolevulinate synthase presequence